MDKKVKAATKKATTTVKETLATSNESLNKVKATAKIVNDQIMDTASIIADDIKDAAQEIKNVATKSVTEITKKVDFKDSVKKVKSTAKVVNKQVSELTEDIVEEVKEKGTSLKNTTTKLAKEAIENANLTDRFNDLKKVAKNANQFALDTTENLIEGFVANSEKWQGVAEKAVKSGLKVAEKQQNLMFNTLEAVKVQLGSSALRFKKLFRTAQEKK